MRIIQNSDLPTPAGHYSMCIEHNGLLYLSGQLPKDPDTGKMPEGVRAQTQQALENVLQIVEAAGSELNKIIQMRIYTQSKVVWDSRLSIYSLLKWFNFPNLFKSGIYS